VSAKPLFPPVNPSNITGGAPFRSKRQLRAELAACERTIAQFREELMRCGLLAVSERADGCVPRSAAERIRGIAHRLCWPEDTP
jgi:hypothetical protein